MLNNRLQALLTVLTMGVGSLGLALTIFIGQGATQGIWSDVSNLVGHWVIVTPSPRPGSRQMKLKGTPEFRFGQPWLFA